MSTSDISDDTEVSELQALSQTDLGTQNTANDSEQDPEIDTENDSRIDSNNKLVSLDSEGTQAPLAEILTSTTVDDKRSCSIFKLKYFYV